MLTAVRNIGIALVVGLMMGLVMGYTFKSNRDAKAVARTAQKAEVVTTKVITKYVTVAAKAQTVYRTLIKQIPEVKYVYIQGKQTSSPVTVSNDFRGVWNAALLSQAAPNLDDGAQDSGITLTGVLTNHVENAQICAANANQLGALIEWLKRTER